MPNLAIEREVSEMNQPVTDMAEQGNQTPGSNGGNVVPCSWLALLRVKYHSPDR